MYVLSNEFMLDTYNVGFMNRDPIVRASVVAHSRISTVLLSTDVMLEDGNDNDLTTL